MAAKTKPATRHEYAPHEIDELLLAVAVNGGNCDRTIRELEAAGHTDLPSARALRNWRNTPRYLEIQEEHRPTIQKTAIARFSENMLLSTQLQAEATKQALVEAEAGTLKDPGKTAQNAAIAAGISAEKYRLFNDQPTEIRGNLDPRQTMMALWRELGGRAADLDSTAEDITDALNPASAASNTRDPA